MEKKYAVFFLVALTFSMCLISMPLTKANSIIGVESYDVVAGSTITVGPSGFAPYSTITIMFDGAVLVTTPGVVITDGSGSIYGVAFLVPISAYVGLHIGSISDGTNSVIMMFNVNLASPTVTSTYDVAAGGMVTVSGSGFAPYSTITIMFDGAVPVTNPGSVMTDGYGSFYGVAFLVPVSAYVGSHTGSVSDGITTQPMMFNVHPRSPPVSSTYDVAAGGMVTVSGSGFDAYRVITIMFDGVVQATNPSEVMTDGYGSFYGVTFSVPTDATVGIHSGSVSDGINSQLMQFNVHPANPINGNPSSPTLSSTYDVAAGGMVTVSGSGFAPYSTITIMFDGAVPVTNPGSVMTDGYGSFYGVAFLVPVSAYIGIHSGSVSDGTNTQTMSFNVHSAAPTVSVSPASWTMNAGQSVLLTATASSGVGPYTFQWMEEAPGASSYSHVGPNSQSNQFSFDTSGSTATGVWSFEVQVTDNTGAMVTSSAAAVTVNKLTGTGSSTVTTSFTPSSTIPSGGSVTVISTVTVSGVPATGQVALYASTDGGLSWNMVNTEPLIAGMATFSGTPPSAGIYLFQSVYSGDMNYAASTSAVESLTVTSAMQSSTTVSTFGGATTVDQTATTGVSVGISGSSAPDGTSVLVTSIYYGSVNPGLASVNLGNTVYYDVKVQDISDGTATISFTGTSGQTTMQYWNGEQWIPASDVTVSGSTITGNIPIASLTGTPIALGSEPLFVTPEYPIGPLLALFACFAAIASFTAFKKNKKTTLSNKKKRCLTQMWKQSNSIFYAGTRPKSVKATFQHVFSKT